MQDPSDEMNENDVAYNFVVPCPPLCDDEIVSTLDFVCPENEIYSVAQ